MNVGPWSYDRMNGKFINSGKYYGVIAPCCEISFVFASVETEGSISRNVNMKNLTDIKSKGKSPSQS